MHYRPGMASYPTTPQIGIGIILLRGEDVLLIRRGKPPGLGAWSLPGGRQELGETAEAAARRELLEETGLDCGALTMVAHADSISRDAAGRIEYHYTILDFAGLYIGGKAVPGDDASACAWVSPEQLPDYNLWSEILRVIGLARNLLVQHKTATPPPP
jgi:ADP-ribose pyrophosphatase YjhB (NUDIX family)